MPASEIANRLRIRVENDRTWVVVDLSVGSIAIFSRHELEVELLPEEEDATLRSHMLMVLRQIGA